MAMDEAAQQALEAAAFRKLVAHLAKRADVQNIDLMIHAGFCRNCLADWLVEAGDAAGLGLTRDAAREQVYGMPYAQWKASQPEASEQQLKAFKAAQGTHS